MLHPEFLDGGWKPFLVIFLVYIEFNTDMDVTKLPSSVSILTTRDGLPVTETGFTWLTPRVLRYSVGLAPPTTSLTFAITAFPPYMESAQGVRCEAQGPFDIFKDWTGQT